MLVLRPNVSAISAQLASLRTQFLTLTDDPAAIAELDRRIAALQSAADAVPAAQSDIANLQVAIEQAVRHEQMEDVARTHDLEDINSRIDGIQIPDISELASKSQLSDLAASIPDISPLATKQSVADVNARIPDVSGLATKEALATVNNRIPDVSGLATKTALSAVEAKIPSIAGLATTDALNQVNARIPDVSGLALKTSIPDISGLATKTALSAVEAKIPSIAGLASQASVDTNTADIAKLKTSVAQFLDGTFTVDTLPVPSAANLDKYARVSDLFGAKRDLLLCSMVGSTYFWQPVRREFARIVPLTADITLTTLKSPTIVLARGSLAADRNIHLSNANAYPGASFEIGFDGDLGLFGLKIRNPAGSEIGSLISGGRRRFFFADGAWQNF